MEKTISAGVAKTIAKLAGRVEAGEFYEAHQMYRTIIARYKAKGQFFDAVELAADGARVLLEAQQGGSGSDVFLMLVNVLETARAEASDEQIERTTQLLQLIPGSAHELPRCMKEALQWSARCGPNPRGDPALHHCCALIYEKAGKFSESEGHFLLATQPEGAADHGRMLVAWLTAGGDPDAPSLERLLTRSILKHLCNENIGHAAHCFAAFLCAHPHIPSPSPPFALPLLNFLHQLLQTLPRDAGPLFLSLREVYAPHLTPFKQALDQIGFVFFKIGSPPASGVDMPSMMRKMLSGVSK